MKVDLKQYVCMNPFRFLEIHNEASFLCIPEWLLKTPPFNTPIDKLWNSEESDDIRKSVLNGSYSYCHKTQCPYLTYLDKFGSPDPTGPIRYKDDLPKWIKEHYDSQNGILERGPEIIQYNFDRTCNYKCPTCRLEVYTADSDELIRIDATIKEIENVFSNDVKTLYFTASGDPFVSKSFRKFLQTFDPTKYPKLEKIHFHTNGSNWNEKMWNSMPNIHKYVKSCEISIDAATKETYETKVRLNGNWDNLMNNLKFISSIKTLKEIKTSFVVQQANYKEMKLFVDTMKGFFGKRTLIFFAKVNNWGTFTPSQYEFVKIWDPIHPEYNEFITELQKIWIEPQVYHNMHDLIDFKPELI